ncbi:hypothetical protein [Longimicrobium sp.]|uniref:hypothetical protein n=1 Tax=Longimicrobium sp. TaxID=2029185 RepID=UPI002E327017|nr:hypothetical protein [Longimicrobium sp.]HEX6038819.1 hypothetical protein [Longimicrobium sp.]
MMRPRPFTAARPLVVLAAWMLLATSAPAQEASVPASSDATLAGRMRAFLEGMRGGDEAEIAAFFPRRGDWNWVRTLNGTRGPRQVVTWRIAGAETERLIGDGGAGCEEFNAARADVGPVEDSFAGEVHEEGWRHVGRMRFVPPGAPTRSPVFVQWRREDGAWVVDAVGDRDAYRLPLRGRPVGMISRDTSLVAEGLGYAAEARWYRDNEPLTFEGLRYVKYGLPRRLERAALARVGVRGRVSIYMEAGAAGGTVDGMLYSAVSPGEYQPYTGFGRMPCR